MKFFFREIYCFYFPEIKNQMFYVFFCVESQVLNPNMSIYWHEEWNFMWNSSSVFRHSSNFGFINMQLLLFLVKTLSTFLPSDNAKWNILILFTGVLCYPNYYYYYYRHNIQFLFIHRLSCVYVNSSVYQHRFYLWLHKSNLTWLNWAIFLSTPYPFAIYV